jgi:hypothetical protein
LAARYFLPVQSIFDQLTSRDAALLTWLAVAMLWIAWSAVRRDDLGLNAVGVVRAFLSPRVSGLVSLVVCWQVLVIYLAAQVELWDTHLLKDTVVIVVGGGFITGFKAHALTKGESTWRREVRSVITIFVVIQWLANIGTFHYLIEVVLVPVALMLGEMQAVATHQKEHKAALPVIDSLITLLGLAVLIWAVYRILSSLGSTRWDEVGQSLALGFWLPAALLPAVYLVALVMQYGSTLTRMKIVRPQSWAARMDLYRYFGLNLRSLNAFALNPQRAREYARAQNRAERLTILRSFA